MASKNEIRDARRIVHGANLRDGIDTLEAWASGGYRMHQEVTSLRRDAVDLGTTDDAREDVERACERLQESLDRLGNAIDDACENMLDLWGMLCSLPMTREVE